MVSNSEPLTSPILTRFDLPLSTSFEPLSLFALLAHYGFQSFEYPTTLNTTCAPSFIFSLIIILSFRKLGVAWSRMEDLVAVPPFPNAGMRIKVSQVCQPFEMP